jgi:hypothetical protein
VPGLETACRHPPANPSSKNHTIGIRRFFGSLLARTLGFGSTLNRYRWCVSLTGLGLASVARNQRYNRHMMFFGNRVRLSNTPVHTAIRDQIATNELPDNNCWDGVVWDPDSTLASW